MLAHVGEGVPEPAGGLLPTVAWSIDGKVEYALDGGVFAAGAMLEWMCSQLGIAEDPPALSKLAREAESSAGARVLPGLAGIGAPWWRPNARAVISGIYGGTTRRERRAGGARGDRLAGCRRGRGDPRDRAGRDPAGRRRADQRAAPAPAAGRHRSARRSRRRAPTPPCSARRRSPGWAPGVIGSLDGPARDAARRPPGRAGAGRRLAHSRARSAGRSSCGRRKSSIPSSKRGQLSTTWWAERSVPPRAARPQRRRKDGHV